MPTSQNNWPVVAKSACDQGPFQGVTFPNGILAGDVATIARWQLMRYEQLVEPLIKGSCWGWFVKKITGSSSYSNHSSATAWDINAEKYPLGAETTDVMSSSKIGACRRIVREAGGVLRWGGDYSGRKDVMHWEIHTDRVRAATFAAVIRRGDAPGQEEHVDKNDAKLVVDTLLDTQLPFPYDEAHPVRAIRDLLRYIPSATVAAGYVDGKLAPRFAALTVALNKVAEAQGHPVDLSDEDTASIVSGLLAGLPADLAQKVAKAAVDEAAARLAGEGQ